MTNEGIPQVSKIHPLKKKLLPKKQTTEYNAVSGNPGSYQKGGYRGLNRIIVKGSLHVTPQGIYHIKYRIIDPVTGASKSKTKSTGFRAKDNTKRKAEQYEGFLLRAGRTVERRASCGAGESASIALCQSLAGTAGALCSA